ncbi:MAG TPA: hypothetical protein PKA41_06225 [Verrucomicrobiota bacterium]|nr:hypothetical protein [Verrucomicrobiota bacterium]
MTARLTIFVCAGALLVSCKSANASSIIPLTTQEHIHVSDAVFRGTVTATASFRDGDGLIYTATSLRVNEAFKGQFPPFVKLVHRGGIVGNEGEFHGLSPRFRPGGEYLVFVSRTPDGSLHCTQGAASAVLLRRQNAPAAATATAEWFPDDESLLDQVRQLTNGGKLSGDDVSDQAGDPGFEALVVTGLLTNADGNSSRFVQPDRGEPIPYIIDADSYPAALTLSQATNAVNDALNAWSAVSSLKFRFDGLQSFGQGADTVLLSDEKLRIQLHDLYNRINTTNVLGIGGRSASSNSVQGTTWNLGGNVGGNEFWKTTRGYVVLEATNTAMNNLATFTEVLCHEIGHALSMAHSSEVVTNDAFLTNSIMYFRAHADGRGATLGDYDPPVIQQAYPSNTPPFTFNRYLDVTTGSPTPSVAGINEVEVRGYDLQTTNLTLIVTNETGLNGTFSQVGNKIQYTPNGVYGFNGRLNPAGNTYKDQIYFRYTDGTNASPYGIVRVLSWNPDISLYPTPSDGISDRWTLHYFGHEDPQAADKSRPNDDADNDGLTNFQEYLAGTDPTDSSSAQRILSLADGVLQFQARPYELYEVLGSTNLTHWSRFGLPIQPTNAPIQVLTNNLATNIVATVSNLPTTGALMLFRIQKVP